jgi:alpha-1,3/alpha-1,6-mannosyltransferase
LSSATVLIYTPSNEHFGIVPVEAMYACVPVVAVDSGGPRESIIDGQTGHLVEADVEGVAGGVRKVLDMREAERSEMGRKGRDRVGGVFGLGKFVEGLEGVCEGRGDFEGRMTFYGSFAGVVLLLLCLSRY